MAMTKPKKRVPLPNQKLRTNNHTGVTGVSYYEKDGYGMYRAQLQLAGGPRFYKEFWVGKFGNDKALAMAVAERTRQLKQAEAYRARHPRPPRSPQWKIINEKGMYGITRVLSSKHPAGPKHSTKGWGVSLTRNQRVFNRQFADSRHGGQAEALAAAKAWRDGIVRRYKPLLKRDYAQAVRRNSTTGVAGVTYREDGDTVRYIARTTLADGKRVMKSFSVAIHGSEGAFKLAQAERKRQLQQVEGYLVHSPGALDPSAM